MDTLTFPLTSVKSMATTLKESIKYKCNVVMKVIFSQTSIYQPLLYKTDDGWHMIGYIIE